MSSTKAKTKKSKNTPSINPHLSLFALLILLVVGCCCLVFVVLGKWQTNTPITSSSLPTDLDQSTITSTLQTNNNSNESLTASSSSNQLTNSTNIPLHADINSIEFDGYLFTNTGHTNDDISPRSIVKIPLGQEINIDNSTPVLILEDDFDYPSFHIVNDVLYISTKDEGYQPSQLYRLDHGHDQPQLIIQSQRAPTVTIIPSHLQPDKLLFITFTTGDMCASWGELWYYLPEENYAELISYLDYGCNPGNRLYNITHDDTLIIGHAPADAPRYEDALFEFPSVTQINTMRVNPQHKTVDLQTILDLTPLFPLWEEPQYDKQNDIIYIPSNTIYRFDIASHQLTPVLDLQQKIISAYPNFDFREDIAYYSLILLSNNQLCFGKSSHTPYEDVPDIQWLLNPQNGHTTPTSTGCFTLRDQLENSAVIDDRLVLTR